MWGLLSLKARVWIVVGFTLVVALGRAIITGLQVSSIFDVVEPLLSASAMAATAGIWLGRFRWAWRLPCWFGLRRWYPDLNGNWTGQVTSNFSVDQTRQYDVEVLIDQRWNGIHMDTRGMASGIPTETVIAVPQKEGGTPLLWTHFVGRQDAPVSGDDRFWYGSSRFTFDRQTGRLLGSYWTDRAARLLSSGGTAGSIVLTRKA